MPTYRATTQNPTTNIASQPAGNLAAALFDSMYQTLWNVLNDSSNGYAVLATDTGSVNNYVLTNLSPALAYRQGMQQNFITTNSNTGPAQVNVDGLGNVAITTSAGVALTGHELSATNINSMIFDGIKFRLINVLPLSFLLPTVVGWACYSGSVACTNSAAATVTNWTKIASAGVAITLDVATTNFTVPGVSIVQVGGTTPNDIFIYQVSLNGTSGNTFGSATSVGQGTANVQVQGVLNLVKTISLAGFQTAGSFSVQGVIPNPTAYGVQSGTLVLYISILTLLV